MKRIEHSKIGDIKVLKREIRNFSVVLEKGDKVEIIGKGERGFDIKHIDSGYKILECGWDIFE